MTFVLLGSESQGHRDGGQARASGTERYYLVLKEYSLARRRQGGAAWLGVRPQMCTPRGWQLHTCPVAAVVNSASQQDALNKPPPWRLFLENSTAKPCEGGSCPKQPTLASEYRACWSWFSWPAIVTSHTGGQTQEPARMEQMPSAGARETDGKTLWKKPLLGFIKCCSSMTHEADSCKEIKSREKYIAGLLTAGGYMSGYKCLLSGKGGETPMF